MPLETYVYHGQAHGFDADIWEPGPHKVEPHAPSAIPDKKPGKYDNTGDPFEIPGLISHGGCCTTVHGMEEDGEKFFRTEVRATLKDLNVENGVLTADEITLGLVSQYRRHWWDSGKPHARRVRVIPCGCKIVNLRVRGIPVPDFLPPAFHYSKEQCDAYLRGDDPDHHVETQLRKAIFDSPSRFMYVKNFGRIYLGEWTLLPGEDWHIIHQITMIRLALGSPQTGGSSGSTGQTNGGGSGK